MNKKLISLVLSLILVFSVSAAFAADSPSLSPNLSPSQSPSNSPTINADAVVSTLNVALPADFLATIPQSGDASEEELAFANDLLSQIESFISTNGLSVVEFFGFDVQAAISEKLPSDMAASDLVLRELFALPLNDMAAAYDPAYGDIVLPMSFPVAFNEGDTVVPMLGIADAATQEVTWIALDAVVNAEGLVEITFTEDVFAQIDETDITVMAILA